MSLIKTIPHTETLSYETGASILALALSIWPPDDGSPAPTVEATMAKWKSWGSAHFVIEDDSGDVLAHSLIFRREVFTEEGPIAIGALATVCVHPKFRGRKWGADIVRAAFDYLPQLGVTVSLFQTGVPQFYENLGGRIVDNRFYNGESADNPFWDTCNMIYPATQPWPKGPIDLNGPGY